ncbi:MAG: N-acetylmuramoyl-L-alanine amidase [Paludibacteraceae bacterium]|nr:N-acetylmuramoyl-L-alanine amidase [Paludibacteraceae bacterium]
MAKKSFLLGIFLWTALAGWAAPYTVVIDAGHGGKDAGAIGKKGLMEKNLNLDVSIRLASKIRTQFPEVKVLLTRSTDVFIPLQERADFVNRNNADLFICVHTNAAESRSAHGTEVFILGTDKMDQNLDVAMRENSVIKLESDYQTAYQGFDPNSIESYIMFELMQNNYMDRSLQFASLVQTEFTNTLHREDRGVRQAAFWVLLKSACPSVLVEMGFVSNADEEKYLSSDQGKREITNAIFHAFCSYYKPGEKILDDEPETSAENASDNPSVDKSANQPASSSSNQSVNPSVNASENSKQFTDTLPTVDRRSNDSKQSRDRVDNAPLKTTPKESWRVQIFVSKTTLPESDHNFKGVKGCTYRFSNGLYKYMAGDCATKEEAVQLREQLKDKFPDCFVVKVEP